MEIKQPTGIAFFGSISILYGLLGIFQLFSIPKFLDYTKSLSPLMAVSSNLYVIIGIILKFLYLIAGILILKLVKKGRTLIVTISILYLLLYFTYLIFITPNLLSNLQQMAMKPGGLRIGQVILPLIFLFYFTRPKVKEQLK